MRPKNNNKKHYSRCLGDADTIGLGTILRSTELRGLVKTLRHCPFGS